MNDKQEKALQQIMKCPDRYQHQRHKQQEKRPQNSSDTLIHALLSGSDG